jgi:DNA-binding transcriptional LysR family regulator
MNETIDIDANDLLLFARIVEAGSLSQAAARHGLPKATVSRRLNALETRLGERLLQRTTRRLVLTEFGSRLLEHGRQIDEEVAAAAALAAHRQAAPSGRLRVSLPGDFANLALTGMLAQFLADFPEVSLELDLSPRRVDLLAESYDLAIRMGELNEEASLAARRLASLPAGLYAAPEYLALQGLPEAPQFLLQHAALTLSGRQGRPLVWQLQRGKEHWEGLPPLRSCANSPELLVRLASAGAGIAAAVELFAAPLVREGRLVRVLPEWHLPPVSAWAVFPGRRLMPQKTRVFLDRLTQTLAQPRGW